MEITTSIILIIVFIVIQQVVLLVAINKIDKIARERDIYKDRLGDKIECDRLKETDEMPIDYKIWLKRRELLQQAKRSGVVSETAVMMGEYENE